MNSFWQDLRYAIRTFAKHPGFTILVVCTLALGIGANTAVFSLLEAILLRPLPVSEPDRLVSIYHRSERGSGHLSSLSYPNYEYYRDHNRVFSGLLAFARLPISLRASDRMERISGELATVNYFSVLGVEPQLGRSFLPEEDESLVVVLSHDSWRTRFAADPSIIGESIRIQNSLFTVVGVAPPGFKGVVLDWGGDPPEVWIPIKTHRESVPALGRDVDMLRARGADWLLVAGRLKDGVTLPQAEAAMAALNAQLKRDHADQNPEFAANLFPTSKARFWPGYRSGVIAQFVLLGAVVGLVLLIACFNVANLILVRGLGRRREIAVRLAVGASRSRLVRQLMTESLLLALSAGAVGLVVAQWTTRFLLSFPRPFGIPLAIDPALNPRVLLFAMLICMLTALICGLVPARQATHLNLTSALKLDVSESRLRGFHLRHLLLGSQVAMALLVVITAGLFVRTVQEARSAGVTRDPERVLMARLELLTHGYDEGRAQLFYRELMGRATGLPGVESAALGWIAPLGGLSRFATTVTPDPAASDPESGFEVNSNVVSPGYFGTMGIPILRGRDFTIQDDTGAPPVAVVNEEMAQRFWPGEDPVGKEFALGTGRLRVRIVGVVRDGGRMRSVRDELRPCVYQPMAQAFRSQVHLYLRFAGARQAAAAAVLEEIRQLDANLPPPRVQTKKEHLDASLSRERMAASLLGVLGLLGTLLAAIGIYGVVSFLVGRRTREIGIRMAVGARPRDILAWAMKEALLPVASGCVVGLFAAAALTRFIQAMLYGVGPTDPATVLLALAFLIAVALLACYIPARRAASVDPMKALRHE